MASYPALDLHLAADSGSGALEDLLYAELDTFEPVAIQHQDGGGAWRVFFRTGRSRDAARAALLAVLGDRLDRVFAVDVDDEDWARRSQAALTRVQVGRLIVAPPWDVPDGRGSGLWAQNPEEPDRSIEIPANPEPRAPSPGPDVIVIVIEPSMGFGTGHHATTRLCLQMVQDIDVRGKRVIDVGTGSGVLALAAWRLGASSVTAVDYDPDALQNARDNIERNGATGSVQIVQADLSALAPVSCDRADVVLANLTGAVLQRLAAPIRRMVSDTGTLVVSGFGPEELEDVVGALGGIARRSGREGDWAAAALTF